MSSLTVQRREDRLRAVRDAATVNGIDHLEVVSPDQRVLRVVFVHPLPGQPGAIPSAPALGPGNLRIDGGVRIPRVAVDTVSASGNELTIGVAQAGDFSRYTLRVVTSPFDDATPPGYDPLLAAVTFSFKVECPSDLDCAAATTAATARVEPVIDYLAKDYASFRRQMLERLSTTMPLWTERSAADQQVMLVELLAYVGDQLSYYQDAVATEAYLGTARRRASLRRHARMLDYRVHEGCNARTWIHLTVPAGGASDGATLAAGTLFATGEADDDTVIAPAATPGAGATVFEALHACTLHAAHNVIELYTWGGAVPCLRRGATCATLRDDPALALAPGEVLILQEVRSPVSGSEADADPDRRCAVRLTSVAAARDPVDDTPLVEVRWHARDALRFDLCLEAEVDVGGVPQRVAVSVALGNVLLADHGLTVTGVPGLAPNVPDGAGQAFRPRLDRGGITFHAAYDHRAARAQPASETILQDPREALAAVRLTDGERDWTVQRDLLGSDRFAAEFVVEPESDGSAYLRFGDGVHGERPAPGNALTAVYRIGSGTAGNVGAGTIRRVRSPYPDVATATNPLPAAGGTAAESGAEVRRYAPQAFRSQERAVTAEDWERVAELHPEVQKARACFRWTGSWYTVFVTVDRLGGRAVLADPPFVAALLAHLDAYRIAGYDLELREPVFVSLDLRLRICLEAGHAAPDVQARLVEVFASRELADGSRGFFHPDHFSFGQPLYLSALYAAAEAVDGVRSVEPLRFQRWGGVAAGELGAGVLSPGDSGILRCDSDPNFPEHGAIDFEVLEPR